MTLRNYEVCLFVTIETADESSDMGVVYFDTYSENRLNAVMEVMKFINLDEIKRSRAERCNYDDRFTWYDAVSFKVIRVVSVTSKK